MNRHRKPLMVLISVCASSLVAAIACGAPAVLPATVAPPEPIAAPATLAPPPTPTLEPAPTVDPLLFRDDFDGALGEGWHWLREKSTDWNLSEDPGWLRIVARAGGLAEGRMKNVLLRASPRGNFELETRLKFRPAGNFQIAGLVVYQDDGNNLVFGRAFCAASAVCVGDGLYMDMWNRGTYEPQNFATEAPDTDVIFLRLRRVGDAYTGLMSEDGETWTSIGTHRGVTSPVSVGILAGQAVQSVPRTAGFDYFLITAIP